MESKVQKMGAEMPERCGILPHWPKQNSRTFSGIFKVWGGFTRSWYRGKIEIYPLALSNIETPTSLKEFLHLTHSDVPQQ